MPRMLLRTALGASLRRLRDARGLRLVDVATRARLSVAYVSEVERGRKEASSEVVAALCDALEVPLPVVLREAGARLARDAAARGERTVAARPLRGPGGAPRVLELASAAEAPARPGPDRHAGVLRAA